MSPDERPAPTTGRPLLPLAWVALATSWVALTSASGQGTGSLATRTLMVIGPMVGIRT